MYQIYTLPLSETLRKLVQLLRSTKRVTGTFMISKKCILTMVLPTLNRKRGKKKTTEENTEGPDSEELQDFKMTKAHIIRIEKKYPTCILYKNHYSDEEYSKEFLKVKRRNNKSIQDVVLSQAYCSKLKVGDRKKS